jgi:hypothetical protein
MSLKGQSDYATSHLFYFCALVLVATDPFLPWLALGVCFMLTLHLSCLDQEQ